MNALLSEIRRSLVELDKGLKGQLNMSQSMEDLAIAFGLNEWPGRNPFAQVRGTATENACAKESNRVATFSIVYRSVDVTGCST